MLFWREWVRRMLSVMSVLEHHRLAEASLSIQGKHSSNIGVSCDVTWRDVVWCGVVWCLWDILPDPSYK